MKLRRLWLWGQQEGSKDATVVWTNKYRMKTRVFATTLGHNNALTVKMTDISIW
ncbi:MAG: hypothetical protein U0936_04470 [Planctomycetaceae bacterium]